MWISPNICILSRICNQFGRGSHGWQEGSVCNKLATTCHFKGVTRFLDFVYPQLQHNCGAHDIYAREGETTSRMDTGSHFCLPRPQGKIHHGSHPASPRSWTGIYCGGECFQFWYWRCSLSTTWQSSQIIPLCISLPQTHPYWTELWCGQSRTTSHEGNFWGVASLARGS